MVAMLSAALLDIEEEIYALENNIVSGSNSQFMFIVGSMPSTS